MAIDREEMQEMVKGYSKPILLIIGSHSALDAWSGARDNGLRAIIYTTRQRARIYLRNPIAGEKEERITDLPKLARRDIQVTDDLDTVKKQGTWKSTIFILDTYSQIIKHATELQDLECIQIPNRAFSVYVGQDDYCSTIENDFPIPIIGSRKLLKIENRGAIEEDYYWFAEQAGIPFPRAFKFNITKKGIRFHKPIDSPLLLKAEHAERKLEREFIFAADSQHLEEKVEWVVERGGLNKENLERARVEQIVIGPHGNFNFFYSPLNGLAEWGEVDNWFANLYTKGDMKTARLCLANEFLSIDERRETIWDGFKRLPQDVQRRLEEKKMTPSFEVTFHLPMSIRESLLKDILKAADDFLITAAQYEPPGILGAWCLQTLITWERISKHLKPKVKMEVSTGTEGKSAKDFGLYDSDASDPYMHIPVTQDVALRHGGGTNTHMGIGSQYANALYQRRLSMGDRIALEVKRATKANALHLLVT